MSFQADPLPLGSYRYSPRIRIDNRVRHRIGYRIILGDMSIPTSILTSVLTGALILAIAGLLVFRWDIQAANDSAAQKPIDSYAVYRLDRWTGSVSRCASIVSMPGRIKCE
jgi:hypothetical protein